jgi:hypothetical protein
LSSSFDAANASHSKGSAPLFNIRQKIDRKLRIYASRFAQKLLAVPERWRRPDGRGVRRWLLRLKTYTHVQLSCCMEFIALILTTPAIAISTLGIP